MTLAITPGSDAEARMWATSLELSQLFDDVPWIVIGAQMVILLELDAGRESGRTTGDVDVVVDVRILAGERAGLRNGSAKLASTSRPLSTRIGSCGVRRRSTSSLPITSAPTRTSRRSHR